MGKYHLPPGETLVEELQCLVVYCPDEPVYRQALWGAISQLTKFWIWEPDGAGGEHDAADSWDLAYEATLESFGMLDELLQAVDEVEPLLRALQDIAQPCCDSDESDGALFTDDVEDGAGDVPQNIIDAGYATDSTDWAGFDEYKCMIAHVAVDDMEGKLRKFAPYVDAAGTVAGGVAAIIGIITTIFTAGASALVGGILASTAAAATLYKNATDGVFLTSLADKVAANHDALACAIYVGTDGPTAACNALNDEIDALFTATEALILKNLNTCAGIRAFYGGRHDLQNVAQVLADNGYVVGDFDCSCAFDVDVTFTFDTDEENWSLGNRTAWDSTELALRTNAKSGISPDPTHITALRGDTIATKAGIPDAAWDCRVFEIRAFENGGGQGFTNGRTVDVVLFYQDGTSEVLGTISEPGTYSFSGELGKEVRTQAGGNHCIDLVTRSNGSSVDGTVYFDDIRFAGNVT